MTTSLRTRISIGFRGTDPNKAWLPEPSLIWPAARFRTCRLEPWIRSRWLAPIRRRRRTAKDHRCVPSDRGRAIHGRLRGSPQPLERLRRGSSRARVGKWSLPAPLWWNGRRSTLNAFLKILRAPGAATVLHLTALAISTVPPRGLRGAERPDAPEREERIGAGSVSPGWAAGSLGELPPDSPSLSYLPWAQLPRARRRPHRRGRWPDPRL